MTGAQLRREQLLPEIARLHRSMSWELSRVLVAEASRVPDVPTHHWRSDVSRKLLTAWVERRTEKADQIGAGLSGLTRDLERLRDVLDGVVADRERLLEQVRRLEDQSKNQAMQLNAYAERMVAFSTAAEE